MMNEEKPQLPDKMKEMYWNEDLTVNVAPTLGLLVYTVDKIIEYLEAREANHD